MTLLQRLEQIQTANDLSDIQFAAKLGISRVAWWNIRTGNRNMGPQVLAAILRAYPDLKPFVSEYLLSEYPDNRQAISA